MLNSKDDKFWLSNVYKKVGELNQLTPEIIKHWNEPLVGDVYQVRKHVLLFCPKVQELVEEKQCRSCSHFFGDASTRDIYCAPDTDKKVGTRTLNKRKKVDDRL
jgi:hypothetical protein